MSSPTTEIPLHFCPRTSSKPCSCFTVEINRCLHPLSLILIPAVLHLSHTSQISKHGSCEFSARITVNGFICRPLVLRSVGINLCPESHIEMSLIRAVLNDCCFTHHFQGKQAVIAEKELESCVNGFLTVSVTVLRLPFWMAAVF